MSYTWYNIFNYADFQAKGMSSFVYTVTLENVGQKDILVTQGAYVSVTYEDAFMPIELLDANPFYRDDYAVMVDEDDEVWLGIVVPE